MTRAADMLDHISSAFTREPGSNIEKLLTVVEGELDEIELLSADVQDCHFLSKATAGQLDAHANALRFVRTYGESDAALFTRITAYLKMRQSCGTIADLTEIIRYMTGYAADEITIIENEMGTVALDGFGLERFGTDHWGGTFPLGVFKVEFSCPPHSTCDLPALVEVILSAKSLGIEFLDQYTKFTYPVSLGAGIGFGNTTPPIISLPRGAPYGYGGDVWGTMAWGSDGAYCGMLPSLVLDLPS